MAKRPVFVPRTSESAPVSRGIDVEFEYHGGFSKAQALRNIHAIHEGFQKRYPEAKVLEISSKSEDPKGVKLSAFNLMITDELGKKYSVESAYQSSKVFAKGGPYLDLLEVPSKQAKKDLRLKESGEVIGFEYEGKKFPTFPKSVFYNWLYIHALMQNPELADYLMEFDGFTDIAFNPNRQISCQANAAAAYVSLKREGKLEKAMSSPEAFIHACYPSYKG